MKIGLLWYGNNGTLETNVQAAALRFKDKFDLGLPNTCHVHPSALGQVDEAQVHVIDDRPLQEDDGYMVPGCVVRVLASPIVSPGYYWIGQEEQKPA